MPTKAVSIDVLRAVTESYFTVVQDMAQGVLTNQVVSVDCSRDAGGQQCLRCIQATKNIEPNPDSIKETCKDVCECTVSGINFNQMISFDSAIFAQAQSQQKFRDQVITNMKIQAIEKKSPVAIPDSNKIITQNITDLYSSMNTSSFQSAVNELKAMQVVQLKGSGRIVNVDMNMAIRYASKIIMSTESMAESVNSIQSQIDASMENTTQGLLDFIVNAIMMILAIIIGVAILAAIFYLGSQALTLIVMS